MVYRFTYSSMKKNTKNGKKQFYGIDDRLIGDLPTRIFDLS